MYLFLIIYNILYVDDKGEFWGGLGFLSFYIYCLKEKI